MVLRTYYVVHTYFSQTFLSVFSTTPSIFHCHVPYLFTFTFVCSCLEISSRSSYEPPNNCTQWAEKAAVEQAAAQKAGPKGADNKDNEAPLEVYN